MRTGRVLVLMLAVGSVGGRLEAATGGGIVRAAVRVRAAVAAEPGVEARFGKAAEELVGDLRAARGDGRHARHTAYLAAVGRVQQLDAEIVSIAPASARERVLGAVHALEAVLARAATCGCPASGSRSACARDGTRYPNGCLRRCAGAGRGADEACR